MTSEATIAPTVTESSPEDLAFQRFVLDLALQPLDRFDGFDKIEQIAGSALRYQLNFIGYGLSMAQYTRTPAFTGYLAEAQRNAIRKMCDRRVWSYWATESLLGYARINTDPIRHANVMYTGYFGVMLGFYETLNADDTFDRPGSLRLAWSRRTVHSYDFERLCRAIRANMLERPNCPQYPCEPHLIYPICNAFAFNTLLMHDRLHGTELTGDLIDRIRRSYLHDGWRTRSGRFIPGRLGPSLTISAPVLGYDGGMVAWLNATMPDLARGTWHTIRDRFVRFDGQEVRLRGSARTRVDLGNYNMVNGDGMTRVFVATAAAEMGDTALAEALNRSLTQNNRLVERAGARRYAGVSTTTNAHHVLARFNRPDGLRDLIRGVVPEQWRTGPILADAAYPDVLVAKAVTDGAALDLVLRPGAGSRRVRLGLRRLIPGRDYAVSGATEDAVRADLQGEAVIEIDLGDRHPVRISPR
ncbi:linalool dehydratase/isomerase domain-containing protein [Nocardia thailandica]|uniref:linalool dehydratase/isomerase domain-containing protein n=1 Tax=Nocardia thailandica TaxID=257275 RepID=UPI0002E33588|nr:hypothetical protein [Nocardia thailandica]